LFHYILCTVFTAQLICLLAHMRIHTSGKPCVCSVCWKALKKPELTILLNASTRAHTHTHRGEKLCSCDTCGKSFTQWLMRVIHRPYCTGQRPYHSSPEQSWCLQSPVTGFLTYAYPQKLDISNICFRNSTRCYV
jgi:hypothetical protein